MTDDEHKLLQQITELSVEYARSKAENAQLKERIEFLERLAIRLSEGEVKALQQPRCVCAAFRSGTFTGGWNCPIHGQCF